jgi:hypothetical protein
VGTPALILPVASGSPSWLEVVPWGALIAAVIALTVAGWNQFQARRDRRRTLYSEAYKAALAWIELYYRVRRRDPGNPHELVGLFHRAQEEIDYHEGWLMTESHPLGRAYQEFVQAVKAEARPLIKQAWQESPCDPEQGLELPDGQHPNVDAAKEQFLADVSDHLSASPERWLALKDRYPEPLRRTK